MTLMELLVALVIGSLIITLVVRGLGLSLNLYERLVRSTAAVDQDYRESRWWADSVASLIACTDTAHCLQGNPSSFTGYTLAAVLTPPGQRTAIRWELDNRREGSQLRLIELRPNGRSKTLPMRLALPRDARFSYRHPDGRWLSQWQPEQVQNRLPEAIRIETPDGQVLAYATPTQRPFGRPDYRDMLGL